MTPEDRDAIYAFKAQLETLGWVFTPDGDDLQVRVGDTPTGLTQDDVWAFVHELHTLRRLEAVATRETLH
jgi:hypothetical protein